METRRRLTKRKRDSRGSSAADELIRTIAQAFDSANLRYLVIVGQAVVRLGCVRFTGDVDLTVPISISEIDRVWPIVHRLGPQEKEPGARSNLAAIHMLPSVHPSSRLGVDITFVDAPYVDVAIERSMIVPILDYPIRFAGVEGVLIHTIVAWREQDRVDAREILLRHPDANAEDVRGWLEQFETLVPAPPDRSIRAVAAKRA